MPQRMNTFGRRRVLAAAAGSGLAAIAGCLGGISEAGKRPFSENPIAENAADRPRLGPAREDSEIAIVEFFDPSCPSCASFHSGAFEQIESEWVEPGRATVYSLAYPIVEEWGERAIHGLVEVYRRSPDLFWDLKADYYAHQDELTDDSVVEMTESFLADADVDGEAVAEAVRTKPHASYVDADTDAADEAGVRGVPTTFVFVDGEFVTTLNDDGFETYEATVEGYE